MKDITIIDEDYKKWLKELASRYRSCQIKAAIKVNSEKLMFNWLLGRDIVEMNIEERWGESVVLQLSKDLKKELPDVEGLSKSNIYYCKKFYVAYSQYNEFFQQLVGKNTKGDKRLNQPDAERDNIFQQVVGIFQIPWGHHCLILDKTHGDTSKALFYVRKTIENGWSRAMLLNCIDTGFYERDGKAVSNFTSVLPDPMSGLAQEITKDPYNFAFANITKPYNETQLKKSLLTNITDFLIELGTGFAYVGKEYRLQIGETENFIDLLFYHLKLRCYVVVEVKVDKFEPSDIGQLSTYVVACNHLLKRDDDKPTIGLLICKSKDNTVAKYALEGSSQPIGVSEYELEKFYPEKIEGNIPTIAEIEDRLNREE
ncbi:MAG: PDDEXK nuclease domain-containing protein [Paludibacteraceae bacterium]|nr:PDDEXK nuclease domain-containing protein [Paludibacteraceae bacterium]